MDKTGLELQQLKGKLGQVAHIDVWLCSNSGSKSLFFSKVEDVICLGHFN